MDTITFIRHSLNQAHQRLMKSVDGLAMAELTWRARPHANTILEILWHVARADDRLGRMATGLGPQVWESQHWYERFGYTMNGGPGEEYQFLQSPDVTPPNFDLLIAYLDAVHADTLSRLQEISPQDLDRVPNPANPTRSLGSCFRHMATHKNNHHGQIDFIRGLIQPNWDLPPGTGIAQE